jgi:hypothetical protein
LFPLAVGTARHGTRKPGARPAQGDVQQLAAAAQNGDIDGLGKAVRSGLGGLGSSIGGLFDSVGRAIGGAFQGAATAALSTGPLILIVGAALVFFAVVFLWRAPR